MLERARASPAAAQIAAFLLYFAAGRVGLLAPFTSGNVSPVWPAAGAALAAALALGVRAWPAIAAAAFLVNVLSPIPIAAAAALAVGNASSAVLGAYLLRRAGFGASLRRVRDVLAFVLLGALASPLLAATVGTTALYWTHVSAWSRYGTAWRVWWLGDAMGVLLLAPALLGFTALRRLLARPRRAAELLLIVALASLLAWAAFGAPGGLPGRYGVPALAAFPFIVWAALRFRVSGAALTTLAVSAFAVAGTALGRGPFTRYDALSNAVLLQFFLAVVAVTGLIVAAIAESRSAATDTLRELSKRLLHLQDEERRRIARELHDGTGQSLAALKLSLAAARHKAREGGPDLERLLGQSMSATEDLVRDIRTLSYLLHPPLLDDAGLASALRWYVDGLNERGGLTVELDLPPSLTRLSREAETAVFRVVQECLVNVMRHSGSPTARVRLREDAGRLLVSVSDTGRGISDAALAGSAGVGVAGMRERLRELDGTLRVRRAEPGTVVEAELPLRRG